MSNITFTSLALAEPILRALTEQGYETPTPIQAQAIPHVLAGQDLLAAAQTGTGKTAGFTLPILQHLLDKPLSNRKAGQPRVLIMTPTRELTAQVEESVKTYGQHTSVKSMVMFGGVNINPQINALRKPIDILVATPGRLLDHLNQKTLDLSAVEILVLDEADRMLDMGFIPQVRQIVARTPRKDCRQTLLFSATYTPEIVELSSRWAMDPIMVEVASERVAADAVDQIVYLVTTADKYNLLYNLINEPKAERIMVFSNRRDQVRKLADNLHRNGISVGMLSGEVAQNQRIRTLDNFKEGKLQVLVATDVAGRGLHIDDVTHVINYTLPEEPEDYVHRIGRTGRAGAIGTSISFACEEDSFLLPDIEEQLGMKLECTHPEERLLVKAPKYERETKFKAKDGPRTGGSRPSGGSGSRSPRGR